MLVCPKLGSCWKKFWAFLKLDRIALIFRQLPLFAVLRQRVQLGDGVLRGGGAQGVRPVPPWSDTSPAEKLSSATATTTGLLSGLVKGGRWAHVCISWLLRWKVWTLQKIKSAEKKNGGGEGGHSGERETCRRRSHYVQTSQCLPAHSCQAQCGLGVRRKSSDLAKERGLSMCCCV